MGARELLLVRHGESTANVAASAAEATGAELIDAPLRDADVPLTDIGMEQAEAVATWLRTLPDDEFPDSVWCSPYLRAAETARIAAGAQRRELPVYADERLRDRELGILDTLTTVGVEARWPDEAVRRRRLGKFYYRPPGGESWADVALRLRSVLADVDRRDHAARVLLVSHDAVITLVRYICEGLSEADVLRLAKSTPILNASVTRLVRPGGAGPWRVELYNSVDHLQESGTRVTAHAGNRDAQPR
jgi:broad specificity phosphatase PhoE